MTANQALQLLWLYHRESLVLTKLEVSDLEFLLINRYATLTNEDYISKMRFRNKESLTEFLLKNPGNDLFL